VNRFGTSHRRRLSVIIAGGLLLLAVAALAAWFGFARSGEHGLQSGARPNILFILADDLNAEDIAYMPKLQSGR